MDHSVVTTAKDTSSLGAGTRTTIIQRFRGNLGNGSVAPFSVGGQRAHSTPLTAGGIAINRCGMERGAILGAGPSVRRPVTGVTYQEESRECYASTPLRGIDVMSSHDCNTGGIVTSAGDGACRVAIAGSPPAGACENIHVLAIRDTCAYIKQVVANFNAKVNTFPVEAQQDIKDLNTYIQSVSLQESFGAGPSALPLGDTWTAEPRADGDARAARADLGPGHYRTASLGKLRAPSRTARVLFDPSDPHCDRSSETNALENEPQRSSQEASVFSMPELVSALSRLDSRTYPRPDPFDSSSGASFEQFLLEFEEYCGHTFRGSPDRWIGELGRFLKGEMQEVFLMQKIPGDSYQSVKAKLLKWLKDSRETYEHDAKLRFKMAQWRPTESMRLYASRVEQLFRIAYPSKPVESSKTLRNKYFDTVPEEFRTHLESCRLYSYTIAEKELTWTNILVLASRYDMQHTPKKIVEPDNSVWLGVSSQEEKIPHAYSSVTPYVEEPVNYIWQAASRPGSRGAVPVTLSRPTTRSHPICPRESGTLHSDSKADIGIIEVGARGGFLQERVEYPSNSSACNFCGRAGHFSDICRRRLGTCLICGDGTHQIANCPQRRRARDYHPDQSLPSGSSRNSARTREDPSQPSRGEGARKLNW